MCPSWMAAPPRPPNRVAINPHELRVISYLAPGLPEGLFHVVVDAVARALGMPCSVEFDASSSGPTDDAPDPFTEGRCDAGFMCSPALLWLRRGPNPAVELAGAALVFDDPRAKGQPVYFSDVVVATASPFGAFADLRGHTWAYNDVYSLSGYFSLLQELRRVAEDLTFFARVVNTGSHFNSLDAIVAGQADAAAIDSNVLALRLRDRPELRDRVRVIASWGPFPTPPVVLRAGLRKDLKLRLTSALLEAHRHEATRVALARYGVLSFDAVDKGFYEAELASLAAIPERLQCEARDSGKSTGAEG